NETIFQQAHERYRALLSRYHDRAAVDREFFATETGNFELYGYGIKGFALNAIETAIRLTAGRISAAEIRQILALAQEMLAHPVELLPGVLETVAKLAATHRLIVITKGDLRDQERKMATSGLARHFHAVEILSEKDRPAYEAVLRRHDLSPGEFLMVGNSLKSDVLPVLELGGASAYIPYPLVWHGERVETAPAGHARFVQLTNIGELASAMTRLDSV
ncbi:MAG: HAD hydrolase-like protein, partial [Verrucomicrobiota bacterium]|nr:HAD hydrolase-like protein [Verrucomicrobiota bacterium]